MSKVDWSQLRSFHFTKEPSEADILDVEIRAAEREIRNWDKDDVNKLRDSIRELKKKCEAYNKLDDRNKLNPEWLIRLNQVRGVHVPVFEFPRGYPVWACDRKGSCLCGEEYDKVEKITTIKNKKDKVYEPSTEIKYKEIEAGVKSIATAQPEVVFDTWVEKEPSIFVPASLVVNLDDLQTVEGWGARVASSDNPTEWSVFDSEDTAWEYLREAFFAPVLDTPNVNDILARIKDKIAAIEKQIMAETTKIYNDYGEFINAAPEKEGELVAFVGQDSFYKVTETDGPSGEIIQAYYVSPKLFNKDEMMQEAKQAGATVSIEDISGFGAEVDSLSKVLKPLQVFENQETANSYISDVSTE
jgi:hypothetical protein